MSLFNFGPRNESEGFTADPVYVGVGLMEVQCINPNLATLNELGFNFKEEPVYFTKPLDKSTPKPKLVIYLKEVTTGTIANISITLGLGQVMSKDKAKFEIINDYGQSSYMPKETAKLVKDGTPPENLSWFLKNGVRFAKEGEVELVDLIRCYLNFSKVGEKTTEDQKRPTVLADEHFALLVKQDRKTLDELTAMFSDKNEEGERYRIAFLLGARTDDKGYVRQDIYGRFPMKPWQVKDITKVSTTSTSLKKAVESSQLNQGYSSTNFALYNLELREFSDGERIKPDSDGGIPTDEPAFADDNAMDFAEAEVVGEDPFADPSGDAPLDENPGFSDEEEFSL